MNAIRSILLALSLTFLGLIGGTAVGSLFVPKGSGLAGPAIALSYGLGGLVIMLVVGILIYKRLSAKQRTVMIIILVIISAVAMGWIVYRVLEEGKETSAHQNTFEFLRTNMEEIPVGLGIVQPEMNLERPFYFYGEPVGDILSESATPSDSLMFQKKEHYTDISYAPPWFWPEMMKLDYDLLFLRAVTVSKNWIEVVVNKETGMTRWVDRHQVRFTDWPDFLLDISSVEVTDVEKNPIRLKPLEWASILATSPPRFSLRPIAVKGEWLKVSTLGLADRIPPEGWIKWRTGETFNISYSPLE